MRTRLTESQVQAIANGALVQRAAYDYVCGMLSRRAFSPVTSDKPIFDAVKLAIGLKCDINVKLSYCSYVDGKPDARVYIEVSKMQVIEFCYNDNKTKVAIYQTDAPQTSYTRYVAPTNPRPYTKAELKAIADNRVIQNSVYASALNMAENFKKYGGTNGPDWLRDTTIPDAVRDELFTQGYPCIALAGFERIDTLIEPIVYLVFAETGQLVCFELIGNDNVCLGLHPISPND